VTGRSTSADATAGKLHSMWSTLQDWYELRPGDAAQALEAIRQAAAEWPHVMDDAAARDRYYDRWNAAVRRAFDRPAVDAPPATVLGHLEGEVVQFDDASGVGFLRADEGGPTYFVRWDDVEIEAYFKSVRVGARVRFEAQVSAAGERSARHVPPID
jgi:cold shock CspA family protein